MRRPRYRLTLPAGAYSRAPSWASREHWSLVVLPAVVHVAREVLRRHHIAPVTFLRVMLIHAAHADDSTGRGCTIDVDHVRLQAGCSERTVQRARAAARELGIATEVFRGRRLTLPERIEAYERRSTQRGAASVYALGCPKWLSLHLPTAMVRSASSAAAEYPQVSGLPVDRGTPPVGDSRTRHHSPRSVINSATGADELASLVASTGHGGRLPCSPPAKRRPRYHPAAIRLAQDVQRRVPALRGVALGRLVPAHTRFAKAARPWSAEDLIAMALRRAVVKGWSTDPGKLQHPAAWWAGLLEPIVEEDPRDHDFTSPVESSHPAPTTTSLWQRIHDHERHQASRRAHHHLQEMRARERDEREGRRLCSHGVGDVDPHTNRSPRCAFCRRAAPDGTVLPAPSGPL